MAVTKNSSKSRRNIYKVVFKGGDNPTTAAVAIGSMMDTTKTIPSYDGNGNLIRYIALYTNANLS